jgi:peptidoglycan L-alanyl-D-glutamate endopeptidase CwlK
MTLPRPSIPEPSAITDLAGLAPKFRTQVELVLADLVDKEWLVCVRESVRSNERADWLYRCGREFDDGRGIVTNAVNALKTWHHYGLAVDLGDRRFSPGREPASFWRDVMAIAEARGLTVGADWNRNGIPDSQEPGKHLCDQPHMQWFCDGMHVSPSDHAAELLATGGVEAVWRELHAID